MRPDVLRSRIHGTLRTCDDDPASPICALGAVPDQTPQHRDPCLVWGSDMQVHLVDGTYELFLAGADSWGAGR